MNVYVVVPSALLALASGGFLFAGLLIYRGLARLTAAVAALGEPVPPSPPPLPAVRRLPSPGPTRSVRRSPGDHPTTLMPFVNPERHR